MNDAPKILPFPAPTPRDGTEPRDRAGTPVRYVELAVASNFSFLRGASHPEQLMLQADHLGLAGLGLCDRNSVAGVVRAHLIKREEKLPLRYHPGARLVFADGTPDILAYPRDRAAWGRLCRLLTRGNLRAEKGECILYCEDLIDHVEGLELIVMPGSTRETPAQFLHKSRAFFGTDEATTRGAKKPAARKNLLGELRAAAPGRVRLAAAMLYRGNDRARLAAKAKRARDAGVPLIAVNDVNYHHHEQRALQDVLTCIREHLAIDKAGRRLAVNAERYLKPPAEMARLFRDAPEAIEETLNLSDALAFSLDELRYEYPDETVEGFATAQDALKQLAWAGAAERYPSGIPQKVRDNLDYELALIGALKYAPYFLTVYDIVRFARSEKILCQGRGSAANSTVCFCLGITEVNPDGENAGLLFERFISSDRGEPPDIDVDFEHERREEVIQYIYRRYGRERTGIAATVICYRGRSAIREVGKAFGLSEDMIGALASSIWGGGGGAVRTDALRRAGLDPQSPRVEKIIALVNEIQGFPRHLSQHVGGFVITRSRLDEVIPIMNGAMDARTHVEWDKDDLDALDILKVDVLGLGMLTCIRKAFELAERHYGLSFRLPAPPAGLSRTAVAANLPPPKRGRSDCEAVREGVASGLRSFPGSPSAIRPSLFKGGLEPNPIGLQSQKDGGKGAFALSTVPAEDPAVYVMLCRADSIGVFQVESRAQMSMLPRLKPRRFYDLVIEVAIVRPGPIQGDMVHPYLRRRQGLEKVEYPSSELEAVLHKTLGVPLFQEQAMKIAIVAGGFTPGEADKLRRAMATFKRTGTIGTFREKMINGMIAKNYQRDFAERCFSQIEGFGEYGFPESHAASFAHLVYASAWLKCRYPDVFAAALLNSQPMGFYAAAQIVRDVREHGVEVRPVDVNFSDHDATLEQGPRAAERLHPLHREMAGDIRTDHALRLGMREVKGLSGDAAKAIMEKRGAGYDSVRDLWLRTGLAPRALELLADADAFGSLGLSRRRALWAVKALGRSGDQDDLPLLIKNESVVAQAFPPPLRGRDREGGKPHTHESADTPLPNPSPQGGREQACSRDDSFFSEPEVALPPMPLGEEVVNDYRFLRLSLRAHPASFLRAELKARGIVVNEALRTKPSGTYVRVSGLVTIRQRPGSANGVIFITIEDETGIANVIVWPHAFERFRPVVLGARYVAVSGKLQQESGVIHVVADRLEDLTFMLGSLMQEAPPIESRARADELKRSQSDPRVRPTRSERRAALRSTVDVAADLDVTAPGSAHAPTRKAASNP